MTTPASLEIEYHAEQNLLSVRWLSNSSLPAMQAAYEALLALEPARRAARWLLDIRQCPIPTIESANWVTLNWLPRAAALMAPALLCVAYVISSERAEVLGSDPDLAATVQDALAPNRHYHLGLFRHEEEAVRWLLD